MNFYELCSAYQMAEKKKKRKSERGGLTSHRRPGWGFSWLLEFSFDLTSACREAGRAGRKDPSHDQWKLWGFWGSQQRVRVKTLMSLRKKRPIFFNYLQLWTATMSLFLWELCLIVSWISPRGKWLGPEPLWRQKIHQTCSRYLSCNDLLGLLLHTIKTHLYTNQTAAFVVQHVLKSWYKKM